MTEILRATTTDIETAIKGDERARAYAELLKAIMAQVNPEIGARVCLEMQNHMIKLNGGGKMKNPKMDRNAGIALQIMVAANTLAQWLVNSEDTSPIGDVRNDPRVIATEQVFLNLFRKALAERFADATANVPRV